MNGCVFFTPTSPLSHFPSTGYAGVAAGTSWIWWRGSWVGESIQWWLLGRKIKLEKWSRSCCLPENWQGLIGLMLWTISQTMSLEAVYHLTKCGVCFGQWPISPLFRYCIIFRIFGSGYQGMEVGVTPTNCDMLCFYYYLIQNIFELPCHSLTPVFSEVCILIFKYMGDLLVPLCYLIFLSLSNLILSWSENRLCMIFNFVLELVLWPGFNDSFKRMYVL